MTEKELKHLSRSELLEMLISQGKKVDRLKANIDSLNAKLEERELKIERAGSIAEAALNVNGICEAAQSAADQYLSNVKRLCDEKLAEAEETARSESDGAEHDGADAGEMKKKMIALAKAQAKEEKREKSRKNKRKKGAENSSFLLLFFYASSESRVSLILSMKSSVQSEYFVSSVESAQSPFVI